MMTTRTLSRALAALVWLTACLTATAGLIFYRQVDVGPILHKGVVSLESLGDGTGVVAAQWQTTCLGPAPVGALYVVINSMFWYGNRTGLLPWDDATDTFRDDRGWERHHGTTEVLSMARGVTDVEIVAGHGIDETSPFPMQWIAASVGANQTFDFTVSTRFKAWDGTIPFINFVFVTAVDGEQPGTVPEPAGWALAATALAGLALSRRRAQV